MKRNSTTGIVASSLFGLVVLSIYLFWRIFFVGLSPKSDTAETLEDTAETPSQDTSGVSSWASVSLEDISKIPSRATHQDLENIVGSRLIGDNLIYMLPAKEGGIYVFSFIPTPELSGSDDNIENLYLMAVIKAKSNSDALDGRFGEYVYPPSLVGRQCSGYRKWEE